MDRKVLITGISGQDGSYLADYMLSKGYEVHGMIRRASSPNLSRIEHLIGNPEAPENLHLHYGDLTDPASLVQLISEVQPDDIYNLAAQSHVKVSFQIPYYTAQVTGVGVANILEGIRKSDLDIRFYQASSSEMFGGEPAPQSENTRFYPKSPYATAKVYGYWIAVNYRESYGMHCTNGILFNHESPRRGITFVTRKITHTLANIMAKKQSKLFLGNLQAKRDWGYAPEFVVGMTKILEHTPPDDFVIGTGETHSIEDFLDFSFDYVGLDWNKYVEVDPAFFRPSEVNNLQADTTKAQKFLAWKPMIRAKNLAKIMVDYDLANIGIEPPGEGISDLERLGYTWIRDNFSHKSNNLEK